MKSLHQKLEGIAHRILDDYPLAFAILVWGAIVCIGWWLSQPVEVIYDPDAPPALEQEKWDPNR